MTFCAEERRGREVEPYQIEEVLESAQIVTRLVLLFRSSNTFTEQIPGWAGFEVESLVNAVTET